MKAAVFLRPHASGSPAPSRTRQRGVSLLFSLLALTAMSLAAVALVQSVGTGASVIGNLGLKQDATAAADQATRQAIAALYAQLSAGTNNLDNDNTSAGYYASSNDLIDATGSQLPGNSSRNLVNWQNNCDNASAGNCNLTPFSITTAINGNKAQYVVFRMCSGAGDPVTNNTVLCSRPLTTTTTAGTNKGAIGIGSGSAPPEPDQSSTPYYRVVVRVAGARNTVSFTESIVHF